MKGALVRRGGETKLKKTACEPFICEETCSYKEPCPICKEPYVYMSNKTWTGIKRVQKIMERVLCMHKLECHSHRNV